MADRAQYLKGERMLQRAEAMDSFCGDPTEGSSQLRFSPAEEVKAPKHRNRKSHNQYFTPEFAAEKALSLAPLTEVKNIIDPAAGNGIFLEVASKKWSNAKLFGMDIDVSVIENLQRMKLPNSVYFTGDSLWKETWETTEIRKVISGGGFDLVVGNPPFSSWFHRVETPEILVDYRLAHRHGRLMRSQAIEVLFLEVFIKLARERGYVVIVLPDGVLSNPRYKYVREFILTETQVKHIVSLPRNVFEDTSAKTSILILEKIKTNNLNYLAKIYNLEKTGAINGAIEVKGEALINRLDYWYYHNSKTNSMLELANTGIAFVPLRDFIVYCKTGKTLYGKERKFSNSGLPFLHATNITDVGINYKKDERFIDPSGRMNFANAYARVGDLLFVRVGVGCAGRVAVVDVKEDEGIATDYIHVFRVKNINPYFLAVYLKTKFARDSINLLKHGVGTISINKTDLLSLPIPVVPQDIQLQIEERYKSILSDYRKYAEDTYRDRMSFVIHYLENEIGGY